MRYNNYVLLGIIDLPVCGSIKLLSTILSLNNWTRQLWTLADVDPSPIKIKRSHREDKYILHLHMTIHIIKITYQYCVELNVGHQVLAPDFFFVDKLTPTVHSCFFFFARNLPTFWNYGLFVLPLKSWPCFVFLLIGLKKLCFLLVVILDGVTVLKNFLWHSWYALATMLFTTYAYSKLMGMMDDKPLKSIWGVYHPSFPLIWSRHM